MTSKLCKKNLDAGQDQLSSPSQSRYITSGSPVEAAIEEEDVDAIEEDVDVLPSRKRPRSLQEDQLARLEVPQVGEPAPAQAVEPAPALAPTQEVRIEILEGLLQLAEGSHAMKA
jgi:hypothetical protein